MTRRALTRRLALLALAAALAACGKKGPLERPKPKEEKKRKQD